MRKLACVGIFALLACSSGPSEFEKERARADLLAANGDGSEPAAVEPSSAALLNPFGPMGAMLSGLNQPGPYDEPRTSAEFEADEAHWAIVDLAGPIVERERIDLFSTETGLELEQIANRLTGFTDGEVAGVLLRMEDLAVNAAVAEELRHIIVSRQTGEDGIPVHCFAEQASTLTYYVMSSCASIAMPKNGSLLVAGVGATPLHMRGLLDRFGVEPDFVTVGAYKGAAESLTRTAPSPEMNETIDGILDTAFSTLKRGIASGRGLGDDQVAALIDRGIFTSAEAAKARLIDAVLSFGAFRDGIAAADSSPAKTWKRYAWKEKESQGMAQLFKILGVGRSRPSGDRVALVYAIGNIIDGKGEGILGARSEIASGTLVPALRTLGDDDSVKAIVLRIDSGGGSALASELIAEVIEEIRSRKPVVVSMGYLAASGGYYIAANATRIFALANTLTGSIGVIGGKLVFGKTMERYGISPHPRGRGDRVNLFSIVSRWNASERSAILGMMKSVYQVFVDRVAAGRKMEVADVNAVAQGRVWTGAVAAGNGLVDEVGGLGAAVAFARNQVGLAADSPIEVYPPEPTLSDFLASFGQIHGGVDGAFARELEMAVGRPGAAALWRMFEQLMMFRESRVLAVGFVPFMIH